MHKFKKIIFTIVIILGLFMLIVVLLAHRDKKTGKLTISFLDRESKISDEGFSKVLNDDLGISKLAEIDWTKVFNKALDKKSAAQQAPSTTKNSSQQASVNTTQQQQSNNNTAAKAAFIAYLQQSNLKLNESQNPLTLALDYRDKGQKDKIDVLISDLSKQTADLEKITPPEEVVGYHLVKLRMFREFQNILSAIKDSNQGESIEQVVGNDEVEYLAQLDLILKKYLTYFFYPKSNG